MEPIEIWDAPRLLAFRVTHNPPPMRELTFHNNIQAPHLHGFLEAKRGQFRLIPLDGGRRTRLEGTTTYRHGLYPDFSWALWADGLIHRIHERVLRHIRDEVMRFQAGGGAASGAAPMAP